MEKFHLELLQRERELWTIPTGKSIHNSLARTSHMASPNSKGAKKCNSSTSLPPRQGRGWSEECSSGCRFPAITWVHASPVYPMSQCGTGPWGCNQVKAPHGPQMLLHPRAVSGWGSSHSWRLLKQRIRSSPEL